MGNNQDNNASERKFCNISQGKSTVSLGEPFSTFLLTCGNYHLIESDAPHAK